MTKIVYLICVLTCVAMIAGCKQSTKTSPGKSRAPISSSHEPVPAPDQIAKTGGCDARLQDLSGLFLMYSLMNHRLPDSLDELRTMPGASDVPAFECPVSHQPYVYVREGIPVPSGTGRIIVHDAAPTHSGLRLC